MNIDMDYIKTEAAKQCYWLKDGVFNLPEWTRAMMQIAADRAGSKINSMKRDLDACRPYLKEVTALRNAAMQQWADRSVCDKEDAARYRWLRQKSTVISWLDAGVVVPAGRTGSGFARLECDQLDAAIDKALAAQEVA